MTPMYAGGSMFMLLAVVAVFLVMSTLMQRPLKKQAEAQAQMRAQVGEGDRVLLASGLFGTVTHVGDEQMIVELAPGVEVTTLKDSIARMVTAEDEEFVYDDEAGTADDELVDAAGPAAGAQPSAGATAAPRPEAPAEQAEVSSDAATMTSAAPGTEEGLGMPTERELRAETTRSTDA